MNIQTIEDALHRHNGNISAVSRETNLPRKTIRVHANRIGFTERGSNQMKCDHSQESDEIIRKHGTELGKATAELNAMFGAGWYWRKVRDRAIVLGVIAPEANLIGKNVIKVCVHTDETDAVIRKNGGNIKATCIELGWGNNRAVRSRAIELGIIENVKRKGGPPIKYVATPETDAIFMKHPQEIQRCVKQTGWDKAAIRRRMVELEIINPGQKIKHRKYKHTRKTDNIIRDYKGHTSTLVEILGWPQDVILQRAIKLGVRKKGEHLPHEFKYVHVTAIDEVIRKHNGHVLAIHYETGWGKDAIRKRVDQLGIVSPVDSVTNRTYTYQKMYIPTPEVDAIIEECWTTLKSQRGGGCVRTAFERVKEYAKSSKTPIWSEGAITTRARELGFVRGRKAANGMRWTDDENKIILDNTQFTVQTIQRKLEDKFPFNPRTLGAIQGQLDRLRADVGVEGFNQDQLSKLLHVSKQLLIRWTARGQLKGIKREMERTEAQGGGFWYYTRKAVQEFILEFPEEIDTTLIDKFWLLDIVSGGKVGKRENEVQLKRRNQAFYSINKN